MNTKNILKDIPIDDEKLNYDPLNISFGDEIIKTDTSDIKKAKREKNKIDEKVIRTKIDNNFYKIQKGNNTRYEVIVDFGRINGKQKKVKKTFQYKKEAEKWKRNTETQRDKAKEYNIEVSLTGVTFKEAAEDYYKNVEKLVEKGVRTDGYLNQLRIQNDHFNEFFCGERTKYVKLIQTKQIKEYFEWEIGRGYSKKSIQKYKSHLKAIWNFMLQDKIHYGVEENVVELAAIEMNDSDFKAVALNYLQLNELIDEAVKLEDPSFLFLVVFSLTQCLRRGELCGLQWGDIDWDTKKITIQHNRVQIVTNEVLKLPKTNKKRVIELHTAGYETLKLYKEWQEEILGRNVKPNEFVMKNEINLLQNYNPHVGKVSRVWKEIFNKINKQRVKNKKEKIPYCRLHDGRHTYITLGTHGIKKTDGTIIPPCSLFQLFESAGHELPPEFKNTSTTVYNEDLGDRWDVTRFWNDTVFIKINDRWNEEQQKRQDYLDGLPEKERNEIEKKKQKRYEKAKNERMNGKEQPRERLIIYR